MSIPTLILSQTGTNTGYIDFTANIDSTYDEYMFVCTNINPENDNVHFNFQVNADGESGFNETVTSAFFVSGHSEADSTVLSYDAAYDQAQGTNYQVLSKEIGTDADQCSTGILHLFTPSNTTYVKHWYSRMNSQLHHDWSQAHFASGYFNITAAITQISFAMSAGNMNGTIQMYGVA